MIHLDNLTYSYRHSRRNALTGITAEIGTGIHLLLGENGAGKTTLLHIIAGLRTPATPTECEIDGAATSLRQPEVMRRVFLVSDDMSFPFKSINEMVRYHSIFYPTFDQEMLHRNLETFGMTGREPIDSFSLGNRKKAFLAYAFALRTDILLLDEPANGLDISAKQQTLNMMAECVSESQTVILSTHTVSDFQQLFDSVIVLSAGNMVLNNPIYEIIGKIDFVNVDVPPTDAIYIEQSLGRFKAIMPHRPDSQGSDIDYVMLFNSLQSLSSRHALLSILNSNNSEQ